MVTQRRQVPEIAEAAEIVMKEAIHQSGRRNFVWRCLFMLWPSARDLLTVVSHRIGNEICLPGDDISFLGQCIATGASTFHGYRLKAKRDYESGEWDRNVYVLFFAGLFLRAADAQYCEVKAENGNTWSLDGAPYLEWRRKNPGPMEIIWRNGNERLTAEQLARELMEACGGPQTWIADVLLTTLAGTQHGS